MPRLATELAQVPVDVLFTMGTRASRIVAETVKSTPLVVYSCDPFEHVTQLARPGGNLTGVTCMTTELSPKRLELLKEAVPKASRVMFLQDPEAAPNALKLTQEVAPRLGVRLQVANVGTPGAAGTRTHHDREGASRRVVRVPRCCSQLSSAASAAC